MEEERLAVGERLFQNERWNPRFRLFGMARSAWAVPYLQGRMSCDWAKVWTSWRWRRYRCKARLTATTGNTK